ncbi:MAG: serine/threonine protein kinase [Legionellales bacterium]|nr:serine/threonine protein kinase [Legionellales bacterium]
MSKHRLHFKWQHIRDRNKRLLSLLLIKMEDNLYFHFKPNTLYTVKNEEGVQVEFFVPIEIDIIQRRPENIDKINERRFEFVFSSNSTLGTGHVGVVKKSHCYAKTDSKNKILSIKNSKKAVKFLKPSSEEKANKLKSMLINEKIVNNARYGQSQAIFFGYSKDFYSAALIMRCLPGKEIQKLLNSNADFCFSERLIIANAIRREMARLHDLGYVHHDLKLDNFIFDMESGKAYLIDFGLANPIGEEITTNFRNVFHVAPELSLIQKPNGNIFQRIKQRVDFNKNNPNTLINEISTSNKKHDYYSYGIILEHIFSGKNAYKGCLKDNKKSILRTINNFKKDANNRPNDINEECALMETLEQNNIKVGFRNLDKFIITIQDLIKKYTDSFLTASSKKDLFLNLGEDLTRLQAEISNVDVKEKNWITYLKKYNKFQVLYAKIDNELVKEANVFRPKEASVFRTTVFLPTVAKIASSIVTPLAWVAGIFSDKYKRYGIIRTKSANILLTIENEFKKLNQEAHYYTRRIMCS